MIGEVNFGPGLISNTCTVGSWMSLSKEWSTQDDLIIADLSAVIVQSDIDLI